MLADLPAPVVVSPTTTFQWLLLPPLVLLALFDGYGLVARRPAFRRDRAARFAVWVLAAVAVYNPELTSKAAQAVGISYGKDLVLYGFVLAFLAVSFAFYAWTVRTERQITELVRHIAQAEARRGGDPPVS